MVNDTVGTMMTCAYEEPTCEMGLIVGESHGLSGLSGDSCVSAPFLGPQISSSILAGCVCASVCVSVCTVPPSRASSWTRAASLFLWHFSSIPEPATCSPDTPQSVAMLSVWGTDPDKNPLSGASLERFWVMVAGP